MGVIMADVGNKKYLKLSFGEWVILVGAVLSVGASHARIGSNTDNIKINSSSIEKNKAFGIARDHKIEQTKQDSREYARDYAYRKVSEVDRDIEKLTDLVGILSESKVATQIEISHIKEDQEEIKKDQTEIIKLLKELIKGKE